MSCVSCVSCMSCAPGDVSLFDFNKEPIEFDKDEIAFLTNNNYTKLEIKLIIKNLNQKEFYF